MAGVLRALPSWTALGVGAASFAISYNTLRLEAVAVGAVADGWPSYLLPLLLDGGVLSGSAVLWQASLNQRRRPVFPFLFVMALVVLSVVVNVAHAGPSVLAKVIAALPPLVLLGCLELVIIAHRSDPDEQTPPQPAPTRSAAADASAPSASRVEAERVDRHHSGSSMVSATWDDEPGPRREALREERTLPVDPVLTTPHAPAAPTPAPQGAQAPDTSSAIEVARPLSPVLDDRVLQADEPEPGPQVTTALMPDVEPALPAAPAPVVEQDLKAGISNDAPPAQSEASSEPVPAELEQAAEDTLAVAPATAAPAATGAPEQVRPSAPTVHPPQVQAPAPVAPVAPAAARVAVPPVSEPRVQAPTSPAPATTAASAGQTRRQDVMDFFSSHVAAGGDPMASSLTADAAETLGVSRSYARKIISEARNARQAQA